MTSSDIAADLAALAGLNPAGAGEAGPPVTKAVIPAAGLGTRFLPATKATPKEMLPVVDRPAIQYVVEEAVRAGLDDVLMITGRNKQSLENHFDRAWELEAALEAKGDRHRLEKVQESNVLADLHYTRQGDPRGLGHAVLCGALHVGRHPFAVLLGDDLIDERDELLTRMIGVQRVTGGSVVALMEVDPSQVHMYGCAAIERTSVDDVVRITGMVEKPDPADAPSNLAVIGRYVLHPRVFDVLKETKPGRGNEIQLTDALQELAQVPQEVGGGMFGVVFSGRRYDTGDRLDYLKAVVQLAAEREDLGPDLRKWLRDFVPGLPD
ncbi:UTP--glucose-1-phosphate uridylyltransferase GalU [Spongisporangium articulatum]|uniref:UTP--glucose-1-phosphate uridylyltransferase n=1 Tax=Spongisporangium articulatum TaxID=3362603 RepID=A0ABW8AQY7_9ACTN